MISITAKPWSAHTIDGHLRISYDGMVLPIVEQATMAQTWAPIIIAEMGRQIAELREQVVAPAATGIMPILTAPRCGRTIDIWVNDYPTQTSDPRRVCGAQYTTYLRHQYPFNGPAFNGWHAGMGDTSQSFFDDDGYVVGWSEIPTP